MPDGGDLQQRREERHVDPVEGMPLSAKYVTSEHLRQDHDQFLPGQFTAAFESDGHQEQLGPQRPGDSASLLVHFQQQVYSYLMDQLFVNN